MFPFIFGALSTVSHQIKQQNKKDVVHYRVSLELKSPNMVFWFLLGEMVLYSNTCEVLFLLFSVNFLSYQFFFVISTSYNVSIFPFSLSKFNNK